MLEEPEGPGRGRGPGRGGGDDEGGDDGDEDDGRVTCRHCAKRFQQRKLHAHLNYCRVSRCTKRDAQERQCDILRIEGCQKVYYFSHNVYKQ